MTTAIHPRFGQLDQLVATHVAMHPERTALVFEGCALSWREFDRLAGEAAQALAQAGVRAGDRVAWLGYNHPVQLAMLFALARMGAVLVPLNIRLAPPEWAGLMADCGASLLVHDAHWQDAAAELAARSGVRALSSAPWYGASLAGNAGLALADVAAAGAGEAPVLLVFTSGTTSRPKAAVHTQANLLANMAIASQAQAMTPDDVVATVLPMFHVGGLCIQTLPALYTGARVLLHSRFQPGEMLRCLAEDRPSLTLVVPAVMKALIEHPLWAGTDLSCLRAAWAGSSVLPTNLVGAFHARGVPVCNVYGSTETGPFSIALPPASAMDHVGSCGWPPAGVEVRLAAPGPDGAGEILVRAPNVVERYWPDQPARDADGWFHTGDLARQAADGSYTVVGRAKDLIISGGENIHPAEIEEQLAGHADVLECAAFGLPDSHWGEAVAVAVVLRPGAQADEAALGSYLQGRLARYKQPRCWLFLEALPRTALGKVQRHTLIAQVQSGMPATPAPAPAPPAAPSP